MKCFCLKITFSAVWACNNRDIFYDQYVLALTVSPSNPADTSTLFPAIITNHYSPSCDINIYSTYTVIITNLPVELNLATTSTSPPERDCPFIRYFHSAVTLSFCLSKIFPARIQPSTSKMDRSSSFISSSAWIDIMYSRLRILSCISFKMRSNIYILSLFLCPHASHYH